MGFNEFIILILVIGIGIWAFRSIGRALRIDRNRLSQLQDFAEDKSLTPHEVDRGPGVYELNTQITGKLIKYWWSRNPSMDIPPAGSTVFKGEINGWAISLDTVLIRKYWTDLHDEYLRLAVELPELPRSLTIFPTSRIRKIVHRIGFKHDHHEPGQKDNLTVVFSSNPHEYAKEKSFLSMHRLRMLTEFEEKIGGVYIYDGKIFLIQRRKGAGQLNLYALYDNIIELAAKLDVKT